MEVNKKVRDSHKLIEVLQNGGIAVIRTDTIYGIVACADNVQAVERLYKVRQRDTDKPCIILLDTPTAAYSNADLLLKTVTRSKSEHPTSFIIKGRDAPRWLLRGNDSLAYRIPDVPWLKEVLRQTGPLIAPSANPQDLSPARTIEEARRYFKDSVDLYLDGGEVPIRQQPSHIIRIYENGTLERLR